MKKRYYLLTAILSYLLLLIATVPASAITDRVTGNQLSIKGVSGTLWHGKAYAITIDHSIQLTNTEWSINAWKLLIGKIEIETVTHYQENVISAQIGTSLLGRYYINNLQADLPAQDVALLANIPLAQLSGQITLNIDHAQWKQGELPVASGVINWKNATITVAETASLGDVNIIIGESEQQLLNADIKNQGGDLTISGNAELVPEADYATSIKLSPTATASNGVKQSLGLFAKKQPNGDYLLNNSGSLKQIGLM